MKENYENRQTYYLTRRVPVIIRLDGKAFHTYTKNLDKPFDKGFVEDMNETAIFVCKQIQGAKCAFVQSDEISVLVTDFDNLQTNAWFDYNKSKVESISAGWASAKFNQLRLKRKWGNRDEDYISEEDLWNTQLAAFDSRAFNIPKEEVANYFLARQNDTVKNSIAKVAQWYYSHKELEGKNQDQQQEMIFQKGFNWNDLETGLKRGRFVVKNTYVNGKLLVSFENSHNDPINTVFVHNNKYYEWEEGSDGSIIYQNKEYSFDKPILNPTIRSKWEVIETPFNLGQYNFEQLWNN